MPAHAGHPRFFLILAAAENRKTWIARTSRAMTTEERLVLG